MPATSEGGFASKVKEQKGKRFREKQLAKQRLGKMMRRYAKLGGCTHSIHMLIN